MRRPRRLAGYAAAVAVAFTLAACGGSGGSDNSPKGELVAGIGSLSDSSVLTTTVRLDTTAAELQALARGSGDSLDKASAAALAAARIAIETKRQGGHGAFALTGLAGDASLLELRVVDNTIYLHGDVRGILALIHKRKLFANLKAETANMPSFVQAAIAGKWVSLDAGALSGLAGGGTSSSSSAAKGPKLLADLKDIVDRDVTVTKVGTDSRGDHLRLTGDAAKLARDLRSSVSTSVPGGAVLSQRLPSGPVQHRKVILDAWVNDGALTELSLDLLQFGDKADAPAGATLPLLVTFDRSGADITPPTGSVPVDLTQLGALVGALSG